MKDDAEVFDSERMKIIMGQTMTDSRGRLHVMHNIKMPFRLAGANELAVLGVSVDITEQKKNEEFRNDIIKTVSHELRTPLSIEREGISLVLDGTVGPLADQQTMILRTVLRNIDRLSRMIDNLLDVSRIEAGKIELRQKPVFLENLIKDVVAEFQPKLAGENLTILTNLVDETSREYVAADSDKIQQVLTNLLDNAIRFSGQGTITVRTRLLASEVECEVVDQGIGIAPENITRMFEKFQQFGRVAGAGEKGLGLGLAIVKGIIDLHRGRVWVKSHSGKGTSVFFTLPKVRERLP
jgi:signal transduction histidine kinase